MKLFFSKTDSIYKILKILEKIPSNKQVEIAIDSEHAFFDNQRWGRQVQEIINTRQLNIVFKAEKNFNRTYFEQVGLRVLEQKQRPIVKILRTLGLFLFDSKRFHLLTHNKQQYLTYLILDLLCFGLCCYFLCHQLELRFFLLKIVKILFTISVTILKDSKD